MKDQVQEKYRPLLVIFWAREDPDGLKAFWKKSGERESSVDQGSVYGVSIRYGRGREEFAKS
jgi:hypothetical protein